MAKVVGDIAISVGADVSPLERDMARGGRSVDKFGRKFSAQTAKMERMAKRVAVAFAGITVAAGALAATANVVFDYTKNLRDFSQVAGVGVERFQSLTYAASQYGISQEKLSDILKDVNDKLGDFAQTGGGPMLDFFENIAPKVGVTIEQFRRLNSADALALYVDSLERANVSQADMTFYMEAIANDATRLIPLLANNASEMNRLEGAASELGVVIGEELVDRTARMANVWNTLVDSMRAKFVSFASMVLVGLDNIFGITDQGVISNQRALLLRLNSERAEVANQIRDEQERGTRSVIGPANTEIERLQGVLEAINEEYEIVNQEINRIETAMTEREAAEARLAEALANEGGGAETPGGGGGGGGTRGPSETDLERLKDGFASEREIIIADYEEKQALLQDFLEQKRLTQEEYNELEAKLQADHNQRMKDLEQAKRAATLQGLSGMFSDLSSLMSSENSKLFKIGQAAAIADATVTGYQAAVEAWEKGMKIGGPGMAAAFTAASLAKTGSLIAGIASQSPTGGGGGAPATGGGTGGGVTTPTPGTYYNVNLQGEGNISRGAVRGLIGMINDEIEDGAVLKGITVN